MINSPQPMGSSLLLCCFPALLPDFWMKALWETFHLNSAGGNEIQKTHSRHLLGTAHCSQEPVLWCFVQCSSHFAKGLYGIQGEMALKESYNHLQSVRNSAGNKRKESCLVCCATTAPETRQHPLAQTQVGVTLYC